MLSIAVLITCHNRKTKTLECLKYLYSSDFHGNYKIIVYLVDDGSTDGTSSLVSKNYPEVRIIQGNGNLFWNGGMRLAWIEATRKKDYDFYLWLNDDVQLEQDAGLELMNCYLEVLNDKNQESIVTGACKVSKTENLFSYGGRTSDEKVVIPNGKVQKCVFINGNVVLISRKIYLELGNLSPDYTHAMGDFDYGLRALEGGFQNYTTKKYIGVCPRNSLPIWLDSKNSLIKRLKHFHSPNGLNIKEYIIFRRKFWGKTWIFDYLKAYFRVISPSFYNTLKKMSL